MSVLSKYIVASSVVMATMLGMIYAFQFSRIERNLPLSPEQFERLVDLGPPTKDFGSNNSVTTRADDFVALAPSDSPTKESGEQTTQDKSFFQRFFSRGDSGDLAINPAKETSVNTNSPFWIRLIERFDPFARPTSPTKELSDARFAVKPLPTPTLAAPVPAPGPSGSPVVIPQPQQIVQVIEKIVERVVIREVERPVPVPTPTPVPVPTAKPTPTPAPAPVQEAGSTIACSIQAFDNAVGGASHTLIFRCDDPNVCSVAKDGESFIDVLGKGYFNFPGLSPASYKIRCGDRSRSWNSAVSPFPTKPSYGQVGFRWFANDNSEVPGRPLSEINKPMKASLLPGTGQVRLRLAVMADRVQVARGDAKFKLQAAFTTPVVGSTVSSSNVGGLCNNLPDGQYKDVQTLETVKFFDNPSVNDKVLMATRIDDPFYGVAIPQTYNETNSIVNLNAAIPANTPALWDVSLRLSPIGTGELMCFRLVRSDGLQLESYDTWPAVYSDQ
ncbi:MAG: hypothetical protein G01um101419_703 [Parcubacteria group bacterium Gr01-1014_19]|nr:MAG: hypothetical protein G01um101419_703 [Parcubacteria group bacterium Gr01-1014_19]